jgi:hypothetical protein
MRKPGGQIRRPDRWCRCSSPMLCPHDLDYSTRSSIRTIIVYSLLPLSLFFRRWWKKREIEGENRQL